MPRQISPRTNKKAPTTEEQKMSQFARFENYLGKVNFVYCDVPLCTQHVVRGNLQSDHDLAVSLVHLGWRIDLNKFIECPKHSGAV